MNKKKNIIITTIVLALTLLGILGITALVHNSDAYMNINKTTNSTNKTGTTTEKE